MIYWLSIYGYGIALTKGILRACSTRKFCVFKALKEHFPCFLRGIFIKVVNFSHLKIQDFVMHFIYNFLQLRPPFLKQLLLGMHSEWISGFCSY
jgi:hypothetical protein